MGVVYRSTHPRLDIPVAIKVLAEQYSSDTSFRQRFHREAATVAALNHPGIVRVYDFDEDGPVLFIVMEWVDGRSRRLGRPGAAIAVGGRRRARLQHRPSRPQARQHPHLQPWQDENPRLRNLEADRRQAQADGHWEHGRDAGVHGAGASEGRGGREVLRRVLAGHDPLRASAWRAAVHGPATGSAALAGVRPAAGVDRHPLADHGDHLEGDGQGPVAALPDLRGVLGRVPLHAQTRRCAAARRNHVVGQRGAGAGHGAASRHPAAHRWPKTSGRLHLCRLR